MPFATPDGIRRHIVDMFDALGTSEGGIVASGDAAEDVPLANVEAMYRTFLDYRYWLVCGRVC